MARNRGNTSLKTKRRNENPMREYDRLPPELRQWVASAMLPWRAKSVQRAFDRAVARTGCSDRAMQELDLLQQKMVAKDARAIWGESHPYATP